MVAKKRQRRSATFLPKRADAGTWDDNARTDYLTGFRKRKRERRITGHAFAALKARRMKLEERAQRRASVDQKKKHLAPINELPAPKKEVVRYDDKQVMNQWGSEVTVTTTLGLEEEEKVVAAVPKKEGVDTEQLFAGTLDAMKKKVKLDSKQSRRAALRRDRKAAAKSGKVLGRRKGGGDGSSTKSTSRDGPPQKRKKR